MRHSVVAFLSFLVVGVIIVALEAFFLAASFDQLQGQIVENGKMTLNLTQREGELQRFKLRKEAFENQAALLISGYTSEPLVPGGPNLTTGRINE
jgi:cell division protein FtsB